MLRCFRGSIWWYDFGDKVGVAGSEFRLRGKRPCVVVSNDRSNRHSNVAQVIPCTTAKDDLTVIHRHMIINGRDSYIEPEQIITVNQDDLRMFIGIATKKEMQDIDTALSIQLGIDLKPTNENILEQLNRLRISIDRLEDLKRKETQAEIAADTELRQAMLGLTAKVDQYTGVAGAKESDPAPSQKSTRRKYSVWTEDRIQEYLTDYENFGADFCVTKYNLTHKKTAQNYAWMFKKKLEAKNEAN